MNTDRKKKTLSLNEILLKKRKDLPPPQKAFKSKKSYSRKSDPTEDNKDLDSLELFSIEVEVL